jgi:hypothetical protein
MKSLRQRILVVAAAFALFGPAVRAQQPQKAAHPAAQEDRIKKLEDRADAAEKAAAAAAMEKDYIQRTQKLYESYYARTLNTQLWALGLVVVLLTAVFVLVARFSLNLFEQRTKLAITDAAAQLRNEYARILAKEVQKLWDSNAADSKKLKEALTTQSAETVQNLKDRSDFQIQFVQGIAADAEERHDDAIGAFRQALTAYKACKPRNLIETKIGATSARYIFEALRKKHGENHGEKVREELAGTLYNGLEEELALTALQSPWLAPLISERNPALPEAPAPEPAPAPAVRPAASIPLALPAELDPILDSESECRLINN